ncbi:MAG: alpha/beta hydrolase-fold protein [Negativicutes bacterium]|jgi:predicted alpha/beta superfamily hydrolase
MIKYWLNHLEYFFYWLLATDKFKLLYITPRGSLIYHGNAMALRLKIWVYIPEGWEKDSLDNKTVYMLDGQNMFDIGTSAYGTWALENRLDAINDSTTVIVAIQHGWLREFDYSLAQNADTTLERIIDEVIPYVEQNLIGVQTAQQRILGGSSLGANGAIAGIQHRDVFSKFLLFSFAAEVDYDSHLAYVKALAANDRVRVYMDIGTKEASCQGLNWLNDVEMVQRCNKIKTIFSDYFGRENVLLFVDKIQCYHCEEAWGSRFIKALKWVASE